MDPVLIGFVVYLVLILVVGLATLRLNRTGEDFLLAGRRLPTWVAALSERASGESAWLLLGLPGAVITAGLVELWTVAGCVGGIALSWWVIAAPLRRESARLGALTLPGYFALRFGPMGPAIRLTGAAIVIFFFSIYLSTQINGAGKTLLATFSFPEQWSRAVAAATGFELDPRFWGMALGALVIVAYTVMGGFFAVAWTDLVQGLIMLFTLVVLPAVAFLRVRSEGIDLGAALGGLGPTVTDLLQGKSGWAAAATAIGGLSWGLGYLGQPHVVVRYMAIKSPEAVAGARRVALAWAVLGFSGAFLIGLFGAALAARSATVAADPERLMPFLAASLLHPWIAGICISGAVAAMMSTADSQLLVATSAVAEDVVRRTFRPHLEHRGMVRISRLTTLAVGLAGFVLAITTDRLIYSMVSYAWSGLGAAFGPALVLALHWRRTTGAGVLAGMLVGSGATVLWVNSPALEALVSARLAAFLLAGAAVWLASLATRPAPAAAAHQGSGSPR